MSRSSSVLLVLFLLGVSLTVAAEPAKAYTGCLHGSFTFTNLSGSAIAFKTGWLVQAPGSPGFDVLYQESITVPAGEARTITREQDFDLPGKDVFFVYSTDLAYTLNADFTVTNGVSAPCGSTASSGGQASIADGRVNGTDLAAPLAAYCQDGSLVVWDIDVEGNGSPAFDVSVDDISAALAHSVASQQNIMVAEGIGNSLYVLMSNELALVGVEPRTGKLYHHVMPPNVCG